MKLRLERFEFTNRSTIGNLFIGDNNERFCYTLEDRDRLSEGLEKVYGETAIPCGEYLVTITYSPHFHCDLPLLHGVPGFEGVRIHSGNKPEDTEGCILVGENYTDDWVGNSRAAFGKLFNIIRECENLDEEVWIEIFHGGEP